MTTSSKEISNTDSDSSPEAELQGFDDPESDYGSDSGYGSAGLVFGFGSESESEDEAEVVPRRNENRDGFWVWLYGFRCEPGYITDVYGVKNGILEDEVDSEDFVVASTLKLAKMLICSNLGLNIDGGVAHCLTQGIRLCLQPRYYRFHWIGPFPAYGASSRKAYLHQG